MEWCEHIKLSNFGYVMKNKKGSIDKGSRDFDWSDTEDWKKCPICLTDRPISKSLEEKLLQRLNAGYPPNYIGMETARDLVKISRDHLLEEWGLKATQL